jgi:hypothetical protein
MKESIQKIVESTELLTPLLDAYTASDKKPYKEYQALRKLLKQIVDLSLTARKEVLTDWKAK